MIINGSLKTQNRKWHNHFACLIFPALGRRAALICSAWMACIGGMPFVLDIPFAIIYFGLAVQINDERFGQETRQKRPHSVWHHRLLSRNCPVCLLRAQGGRGSDPRG